MKKKKKRKIIMRKKIKKKKKYINRIKCKNRKNKNRSNKNNFSMKILYKKCQIYLKKMMQPKNY